MYVSYILLAIEIVYKQLPRICSHAANVNHCTSVYNGQTSIGM